MEMLRICIDYCVGYNYEWHVIDIDNEYHDDYSISFLDVDGVMTDVFIEKCVQNGVYLNGSCDVMYLDSDCNDDVFSHITSDEVYIFKTV